MTRSSDNEAFVRHAQAALGAVVDGWAGKDTLARFDAALCRPSAATVPPEWMPAVPMTRIIFHWTAGRNTASVLDRQHYHILINGDGTLVRGFPSIELNSGSSVKPGYAAHTLNCNTGSVGVSLCGMSGAVESPFDAGDFPICAVQWDALASVCADLCRRYGIKPIRTTLLSHGEVQDTLSIRQLGKWDIAALPFLPGAPQGAHVVGDMLRAKVAALLAG